MNEQQQPLAAGSELFPGELPSAWTSSLTRAECVRRIKRASEIRFGFMGDKPIHVEFRRGTIRLSGRYSKGELAKGFLTHLDAVLKELPDGGTRISCTNHFVWQVDAIFYLFFGIITLGACLFGGIILSTPVNATIGEIAVVCAIFGGMIGFVACLRLLFKYAGGAVEKGYLVEALTRAVQQAE